MSRYHNHFQWLSGLFSAALCAVLCLWLFEKHKGLCGLCFFPEWCEKKNHFHPFLSRRICSGFLILACPGIVTSAKAKLT